MTYRVKIIPTALADAEGFYLWIAENSPVYAAKWFNGLFEVIDTNIAKESMQRMGTAMHFKEARRQINEAARCGEQRRALVPKVEATAEGSPRCSDCRLLVSRFLPDLKTQGFHAPGGF
jgi:plasmid stabilization system protein ParE